MHMLKLNREEKNWILYDVGNSAFILMVSTIIPIFFNYLAEAEGISSVNYLAYWGYAASATTAIVVLIGPLLGSVADNRGFKKMLLLVSVVLGILGCIVMGFAKSWIIFLIIFVITKVGYSTSLIFYDSMLGDITKEERMDHISACGYAWGYVGSCIPFVIILCFMLGYQAIGITFEQAMIVSMFITGIWWGGMSLPLLKNYKQKFYITKSENPFKKSMFRMFHTIKNVKKQKKIFLFLLAYFFYIDGVYTIIDMATAYGSALGLDSTGLLLALLLTQIVAFPFALLFGRLAQKYKTEHLILLCIVSYTGIAIFAIFLHHQWQFWVLAIWVGMFQGGIQALSRSYYTKIIPKEQSGEYFGLLDICGKGASFLGTLVVSITTQATGNLNMGVSTLTILFIIGIVLFIRATKIQKF
ncbi:MAG: MFS transporter [Lachnospiraceae bacterium]